MCFISASIIKQLIELFVCKSFPFLHTICVFITCVIVSRSLFSPIFLPFFHRTRSKKIRMNNYRTTLGATLDYQSQEKPKEQQKFGAGGSFRLSKRKHKSGVQKILNVCRNCFFVFVSDSSRSELAKHSVQIRLVQFVVP